MPSDSYDFEAEFTRSAPYFPDDIQPFRSGMRPFLQITQDRSTPCVIEFTDPHELWPKMSCDCRCTIASPHKFLHSLALNHGYAVAIGFKRIGTLKIISFRNPDLCQHKPSTQP